MTGGLPPSEAPTKEQDLEVLKRQAEYLENALVDVRKRLQEVTAQEA